MITIDAMGEIRVSIIGFGNVTNTLIKGLEYYRNDKKNSNNLGIWHDKVGGYSLDDIKIVSIFDIDADKVGKLVTCNDSIKINAGMLIDQKPSYWNNNIVSVSEDELLSMLKDSRPDVVVNLISSSMDRSSYAYAECSLACNSSFINATPTALASNTDISKRFKDSGLILVGDDLMSQFGGTVFHRIILRMMHKRGLVVKDSYQLDVGGSSDTRNTLQEHIRAKKRSIKTSSINTELPYEFNLAAGTTEYTEFLDGDRVSYYWIYSEGFMGSPIKVDITMRSNDASNACNVLLDVIRAVKYAMDVKDVSLADIISAYGFKSPPRQISVIDAQDEFERIFVK
jgi:myo-inositol-1-phosphate synthase